jgi:hypothetical protein
MHYSDVLTHLEFLCRQFAPDGSLVGPKTFWIDIYSIAGSGVYLTF